MNGTFLWSYGVTKRFELDLAVPITFGQSGTGIEPITAGANRLHDTAVRDIRFGATWTLVPRQGDARVWGLTARFETSAPTGDSDQFAGDRTAVFVPSLAADYVRGRWFAGAEVGVRARPNESLLGATVGTQAFVALGLGYDLMAKRNLLGVMLEARSLPTFAQQKTPEQTATGTVLVDSSSVLVPSEWMLGVRSSPLASGALELQAGGGGPIPLSDADLTVPRFRFVLGVRFVPRGERPKPPPSAPPSETPAAPAAPADFTAPAAAPPSAATTPATPAPPPTTPAPLAPTSDACKDDPHAAGCPEPATEKP